MAFPEDVRQAIAGYALALAQEGPHLGRPFVDTLRGSARSNMKELRPTVNKVEWRVAFAFDPRQKAILLVAGAKGGIKDARFYKRLIKIADERFTDHLATISKLEGKGDDGLS